MITRLALLLMAALLLAACGHATVTGGGSEHGPGLQHISVGLPF